MPEDDSPDDSSDPTGVFDNVDGPVAELQARQREAILNPDPDETHRVTGLSQVNYRVHYEYRLGADDLTETDREQVDPATTPELLSCSCGVGGMERAEAREHLRAAERADASERD